MPGAREWVQLMAVVNAQSRKEADVSPPRRHINVGQKFFFKSDLTCFLLNSDKNVQIWREKHGGYSQILKGSHFRSKKVSVTEKDSFYNYIMLA